MATMLAFLTTDAAIEQAVLQEMLRRVCFYTFNSITVDGDMSTNDMTLILANGLAGNKPIDSLESADAREFEKALYSVCLHLAKEIARDGEGATKLVEVTVQNVAVPENLVAGLRRQGPRSVAGGPGALPAHRREDHRQLAPGQDGAVRQRPQLGPDPRRRGPCGRRVRPGTVEIALAGTTVYREGAPTDFNGYVVSEAMKAKDVQILVDFHQPQGETATV